MKPRRILVTLIFIFTGLATAVHAGTEYHVQPGQVVVADELIVRLKPGSLPGNVIPLFLPSAQVNALHLSNLYQIHVPGGIPAGVSTMLAAHALVDFVAPNNVLRTNLAAPADPDYSIQWGLSAVQALQAWGVMPAQYLTSSTASASRIKVAVLDTGADCSHPDFVNSGGTSSDVAFGGQLNWSASQALVATTVAHPAGCPWMDDDGHGSHTAGIIAAATSNGAGVSSLGYPLQVLIYKVLDASGSGNSANVANAITAAADAGARVVSMSLGGDGYDPAVQLAINYAWQRNVVVVSAAGNSSSSGLFYPGDANLGLGISATDSGNSLASFSNFGNGIALAAPGVGIFSTFPTYSVLLGCCNYASLSGTSMATPFVAALAGLVATATPGISNTAIVQQMEQTASASNTAGGGWNQNLGYGVINAYNAISNTPRPASVGGVIGQIMDSFTPQTSNPVNGAQITINGQTITTDTSGSGLFRFPNLAAGTYAVTASASGFTTKALTVTVAPGADTPMIIAMGSSYGHFSGTVLDAGVAVPGAVVQALSAGLIVGVAVADAGGNYSLWVPGGATTYNLRASATGRTGVLSGGMTVAVGGNTVANLTLPRMGTITGTVRDGSSHLTSGAQVVVSSSGYTAATTTGYGGTYSLIGLPNGSYSVTASLSGLTPVTQTGVSVSSDAADVVNLQFAGSEGVVTAPVIGPAGGTFTSGQAVSITTATQGAAIRYTTDGSTPTGTNGTLYNGAIAIGSTTTVKAIAFETGMADSSVASVVFTINIGSPGWYSNAWSNRKAVTIPSTSGSATLANFPVLISLPSDANLMTGAQASGNDILFTAADGTTKLNHEVELYNSANGQLTAWVQAPVLSPGTVIYMYYGNPSAGSQQNRTGVWDSSFSMVQHLPNGAALSALDSTANACNASNLNSTSAAAGEIGGGASFNGTSNSIDIGFCSALNNWTAQTVSLWAKAQTDMARVAHLIEKGAAAEWAIVWNYASLNQELTIQALGNSGNLLTSTAPIADNTWHKVDVTIGSNYLVSLYVDGVLNSSAISPTPPQNLTGTVRLGQAGGGGFFYHGLADEVRISSIARPAAWLATEYNNQSSPGAFFSLGAQQSSGGGGVQITVTSSPALLALTVDGVGCTAPCSFQWTAGTNHTVAVSSPQAGATGTQYVYTSWSDGLAQTHTITAPASPATYTANFTTQYFLTTAASPGAGGSINPGSGWYNSGAVVAVSASANTGYTFSGFSGSLTGTATPQNLTMSAAAAVTANFSSTGGSGWYNASWAHRKAVTIDHTRVAGGTNLSSFPMLFSVTDANLKSIGNGGNVGKADGTDILFTASDGVTKLNHELESYNASTGQVVAWVQVPTVSSTADTALYIYFGNAAAADQQNHPGVWDSNYKGVWHLGGSVPISYNDSTSNAANGINVGTTAAATAIIGNASTAIGNGNYISGTGLGALTNSAYTVSAWVYATASPTYAIVFSAGGVYGVTDGNIIGLYNDTYRVLDFSQWGDDHYATYTGSILNGWNYLTYTVDSSRNLTIYLNGVPKSTGTMSALYSGNGSWAIGTLSSNPGGYSVNGSLQEVRASNSSRPAGWVATEYNNQSSPGAFFSLGAQQSSGGGGVQITVTSSPALLALTVDGVGCTAPCSFQWTAGTNHTVAVSSPQAGATGTQYVYTSWSDGLAQTHTITAPASPATYTANFTTQYFLTTAASPGAGGSINPGNGWYNSGAVVAVSASANTGYTFSGFSGSLTGTATPQNLTMSAAAAVTANFSSTGGSGWYNASWAHRKAVTIDHTRVAGGTNLSSFPMLFSVTDANLKSIGNGGNVGKADGTDILFTASDGVTKLNHELESYNASTGQVVAWVQVPTVSSTADTALYIYFGNAAAADQQNHPGVWDSNYKGVWHLGGSAPISYNDSTSNAANGINVGTTAAATAIIGNASTAIGNGNYISGTGLGALTNSAYTVSAWVYATASPTYAIVFSAGGVYGVTDGNILGLYNDTYRVLDFSQWGDDHYATYTSSILNGWNYLTYTVDSSRNLTIYLNGVPKSTGTMSALYSGNGSWAIGTLSSNPGGYSVNGSLQEVRASNSSRPAGWVATEYNNQSSPGAFFSLGPLQ